MKILVLSLSLAALACIPHAFAANSSVNLIGNPDVHWTEFGPPNSDGAYSLAFPPGSIMPGFSGGEMISYNAETFQVNSIGGQFQMSGSFNFADSANMQTYVAGFASGPLDSLVASFQQLRVTYDPFSPGQAFGVEWTHVGGIPGGSNLGSAPGSLTDTVAYDIALSYTGLNNWSLLGQVSVDGSTLWDSTTTPVTFTTSALEGEAAHYFTGVTEGDGPSVSIDSGMFAALAPEPTRAALSVIGLACVLFTRRRKVIQ